MGMLYELDEVEKRVLQGESDCSCLLHRLSESERIALIDRAIDATNAEIAAHGGRLPEVDDDEDGR